MAKMSVIENNNKRKKFVSSFAKKRAALKAKIKNKAISPSERMSAVMELDALPRNSSKVRVRNRCVVTGRPRGYYRKFGISRVTLRELSANGEIPGVIKSSW